MCWGGTATVSRSSLDELILSLTHFFIISPSIHEKTGGISLYLGKGDRRIEYPLFLPLLGKRRFPPPEFPRSVLLFGPLGPILERDKESSGEFYSRFLSECLFRSRLVSPGLAISLRRCPQWTLLCSLLYWHKQQRQPGGEWCPGLTTWKKESPLSPFPSSPSGWLAHVSCCFFDSGPLFFLPPSSLSMELFPVLFLPTVIDLPRFSSCFFSVWSLSLSLAEKSKSIKFPEESGN